MTALVSFAVIQGLTALTLKVLSGGSWFLWLRAPSTFFVAVAALYSVSLGWWGVALLTCLFGALVMSRENTPNTVHVIPAFAVALLVFARPWTPLYWDEFVWLAKARVASHGFFAGVDSALNPQFGLIPQGYPPLWPTLIGWLTLRDDQLTAQVLAASLILVLAVLAALSSWPLLQSRSAWWMTLLLFTTPLVLVHLRSNYVDLPLGFLSLALLGLMQKHDSVTLPTVSIALVLSATKDEGLAHVMAAALAVSLESKAVSLRAAAPAFVGFLTFVSWRWLTAEHGVSAVDHAWQAPAWSFVVPLLSLLVAHASDIVSWGLFWGFTLASTLAARSTPEVRVLRWYLALSLLFLCVALLIGPERVRVFAENGTLLNRLLLQLWPAAALLLAESVFCARVHQANAPDPVAQ
jgi:hypothetical protein